MQGLPGRITGLPCGLLGKASTAVHGSARVCLARRFWQPHGMAPMRSTAFIEVLVMEAHRKRCESASARNHTKRLPKPIGNQRPWELSRMELHVVSYTVTSLPGRLS